LKNKRIINKENSKELVFRRPRRSKFDIPDPLDGIAQAHAAKLLGVIMAALWNRAGHYILPCGFFFFYLLFFLA